MISMQHKRQAPGRDIHKHFSLAPARSHTITASNKASAIAATRNPPPHPDPYKTGPKLAKRRRGHHTCHSTLSLPPAHLPPRSPHLPLNPPSLPSPPPPSLPHTLTHTSNHERAQTVKGGETPPACAPPLSGGCVHPLGNCLTHLKARVITDGEGRRNSARLCITVIRHTSSPSLNHDPRVPKVPTERSSLQCSHGPLLSVLLVPATTQVTGAPIPEALTERGAAPLPSAPVVPAVTQVDGALTPEVPT